MENSKGSFRSMLMSKGKSDLKPSFTFGSAQKDNMKNTLTSHRNSQQVEESGQCSSS